MRHLRFHGEPKSRNNTSTSRNLANPCSHASDRIEPDYIVAAHSLRRLPIRNPTRRAGVPLRRVASAGRRGLGWRADQLRARQRNGRAALKPDRPFPCAWVRTVPVKGAPKAVLLALACFADTKDGRAWPGIDKLALASGLNASTVKRALAVLEKERWISRERRLHSSGRDTSTKYTLPLYRRDHMPSGSGGAQRTPQGCRANP